MAVSQNRQQALGWAAKDSSGIFYPFAFSRRENGAEDVTIEVAFCGVCHTDLHFAKNDWGITRYPVVPGHEITGFITAVGSTVDRFSVGDRVAVGLIGASCRSCEQCKDGQENYCPQLSFVFNAISPDDNSVTYGGYSNLLVIHHRYVVKFPEGLAMDAGAPLMCAGISIYSPMKFYGMREAGKRLGVVGLGGLGHLAVKFGKAFGLQVTVISTSPGKQNEALQVLGADDFIASADASQMQRAAKSLDYIMDTVSGEHALDPLLGLLKLNGKFILVGAPSKPLQFHAFSLIFERRMVGSSMIGGIAETQEMLEFCEKHKIECDIETIKPGDINEAMQRLVKGNVKYRFVIDFQSSF